ncbi:MAG: RdgB/HAM1 family non-canonical purine NTP pyrophosphatase [Prevotellaceae bacterium]|jgi:XTP/dITP diphosphohydrolase|nr:RdgB/HAM1 family non-canonical purine NTP pyrophosphatase [Prevotellaceae bacterium]
MDIVFATKNAHKISEVQSILAKGYTVVCPEQLGFNGEIPEEEVTLEGNALQKARFIYKMFNLPCFSDDTGLEVESLNGAPGVYSARYAGEGKSSEDNIVKLLREMSDKGNRNARFRCVIAYIDSSGAEHLFEGIVNGRILFEKQGDEGFGYDPVFSPEGFNISFAQMSPIEKNLISHRGRAVNKFADYLTEVIKGRGI